MEGGGLLGFFQDRRGWMRKGNQRVNIIHKYVILKPAIMFIKRNNSWKQESNEKANWWGGEKGHQVRNTTWLFSYLWERHFGVAFLLPFKWFYRDASRLRVAWISLGFWVLFCHCICETIWKVSCLLSCFHSIALCGSAAKEAPVTLPS